MLKNAFFACLLCLLLALCGGAAAQTVTMEDAHLSFDFPESWTVVSPQLAQVYAPMLAEQGIDGEALSAELAALNVHARAYAGDFSEWLSVQTMDGEQAAEIYEMERVSDAQRKQLLRDAEAGRLFETTGLRAQEAEWQIEGGIYWLLVTYTRTRAQETIGRGIRYMTVRNGQFVILDWQTDGRRFSNRNLRDFRQMIGALTVTESIPEPMRAVQLEAAIPAETGVAEVTISGTATAGASVTASLTGPGGEALSAQAEANRRGAFELSVTLTREGEYDVSLTASCEGMLDAAASGRIAYSANTLPVSGVPEDSVVTEDVTRISGVTLPGARIQLLSPYGLTKKTADKDGAFSFELTTDEQRAYDYTLILDKSGYDQRRLTFTLTRVFTEDQSRQAVRDEAEAISYRELQKDLEENRGKTVRVYGPVAQVSASGDVSYVRMYYNRDGDGRWYNDVIVTATGDLGVKAGDMLTVVASVAGVYEEQDAEGEPLMVPRLELLFVDGVE